MKTHISRTLETAKMLVLFALMACPMTGTSQTIMPTPHTFHNNVAYVAGGNAARQSMDIYTPTGASGPLPVVLLVHGGGWNSGAAEPFLDTWASLGQGSFAIAAMNYRYNTVVEPLITQVDDVKAAIRFLKANATTYNLNASKVGLLGQSAGGHLAGMAALTGNQTFLGSASDLANTQNLSFSSQSPVIVTWAMPPETPSGNATFVLSNYLSSGDPSFRMFHSTTDETVNISFARGFRDAANTAGVGATLTEISGPHFASDATRNANAPAIVTYFNSQFAAIPEPSTVALLMVTLGAGLFAHRRSNRR